MRIIQWVHNDLHLVYVHMCAAVALKLAMAMFGMLYVCCMIFGAGGKPWNPSVMFQVRDVNVMIFWENVPWYV